MVTGSGVSVGLAKPGSDPTTLPTWHSVLTQLQDRFASRLGPVAADVDLLLGAQPRTSDYLIEAATLIRETVGVGDYRDAVVQLTTAADDARTPLHDLIEDLEPLGHHYLQLRPRARKCLSRAPARPAPHAPGDLFR